MELYSIFATLALTVFITFPGIIFRRIYFQHEFSKQFSSSEWNSSLTSSLFFGVITTIITFKFFQNFSYFYDNLEILTQLKNHIVSGKIESVIKIKHLSTIMWFLFISVLIAVILGHLLYKAVRVTNFDKSITFLRFENHWHYYFTGEALGFNSFKNLKKHDYSPDSTIAEVFVSIPEKETTIYRGQLQQHTISKKTGELILIYLIYPAKYNSNNELELINDVDILMLPYKNILNINLSYHYQENIDRASKLKVFKSLLWILYILNFVLFLMNFFKNDFYFSLTIAILYHIAIFNIYQILTTIYEGNCLKKEASIKDNEENKVESNELYTQSFAYIILFILLFFIIQTIYSFG